MYWLQFPPTFSFLARLRVASNNDDNGDEDFPKTNAIALEVSYTHTHTHRFMFVCMCAL